jgi:trimethylamine---corrinoid protein Co-methyltransferase
MDSPQADALRIPARGVRLSVLGQDELERIHELSLRTLEQTGIVIHYPPALALLRGHGAAVDDARRQACIPRSLVEQALQAAPRAFTLYCQANPSQDCLFGLQGGQYTRPPTGLNWIVSAAATALEPIPLRRAVTPADIVHWTRVTQALPHIHLAATAFDQSGAPQSMEVRAIGAMLPYTNKPLMVSALSGEGLRWVRRLTEVAQPGNRLPRVLVLSSVNSPLVYSYGQAEAAMTAAELGIPVLFNSSAVSGASAPVTLAGALVLMNAEMLAALTILQLFRPGAPVAYAGYPTILDMHTGLVAFGFAEIGLLAAACIELGRSYGLPTASNGLTTDACTPDPLATSEKWSSGFLPFLAGANLNGGAGALASQSTISLEQLVLDEDLYGHMLRHARGIALSDDTLATEVIAQVGPGGSYLAEEHTVAHFRHETWYSPLANRLSAPSWEEAGGHDALARAASRVHAILSAPPQVFLAPEQTRELGRLVAQAEEALATSQIPV